ncbi:uncharacterized protein [Solanum tuberosum]|uniref:uncharacterized protein isoform X2 n=1 Tax=Solanum tuberosum TaxID=4113 RepID=UPI00073A3221|nr:PREDICTED: uncharacterized protein LOC102602084 isoform X2 [Solanum tuberosum]
MATTTKLLQFRPKLKHFSEPKLKFFSSSSSSSSTSNPNPEHTETPTSEPNQTPTPKPFSFSSIVNNPQNPSSQASAFDEVRKSLAGFRSRSGSAPSPQSFQELYQRNVNNVRSEVPYNANQRPPPTGNVGFNAISASLRNLSVNNNYNNSQNESRGKLYESLSLSRYTESFKLRPDMGKDVKRSGMVIGGSGNLPASFYRKEMMRDKEGDKEGMKMELTRNYRHGELGEKLKMLRPIKKEEKGWFSLHELNDRLMKVREADEIESKTMVAGVVYKDLKESLYLISQNGDSKPKKTMIQRLDVLGQLGGTPSFMLHPPKEHLVEKFFHPDNMSSGEKMKLELQKVRDEFKMSESDCGSARVQVAQLTTKIKHLSSVLHKKDKHSRKGLQQMVQNRKKLLKYLRRTDWDSYCLVLSKLGLRDNPDYKF